MDQPADSLPYRGLDTTCTGLDVQRLDPAKTRAVIGEWLIKDRLPTGGCPAGLGSPLPFLTGRWRIC